MAIDWSGNIWVVDSQRIQEFSNVGAYITQFSIAVHGPTGGAGGMAIDPSGNFWLTDIANKDFVEYNSSGTYVNTYGSSGATSGKFTSIGGIATDTAGNVWVADPGGYRVQEFNSSGTYTGQIGCAGTNACSSSGANGHFSAIGPLVVPTSAAAIR
jgi:DNA-binding beta-propeller fold protein YncE